MAIFPPPAPLDPGIRAFLDLIAWSEGTSRSPITVNNGYDVIVSGVNGPNVFDDCSDHPFANGRPPIVVRSLPQLLSTASGRYQLLLRFWRAYKAQLGLTDFSPTSQDAVAIQQIKERGALAQIQVGDIQDAITACSNIWASLPGNSYGQAGGHTMQALLDQFSAIAASNAGGAGPATA